MKRLVILFLFFINFCFAELIINKKNGVYENFGITYLSAPKEDSIEKVSKLDFKNKSPNSFSLGYQKEKLWIKFEIKNSSDTKDFIIFLNESTYEIANLYFYNKSWQKIKNGFDIPLKSKEIKLTKPTFHVNINKNQSKIFYLELKTGFSKFGKVSVYKYNNFFNNNIFDIDTIYNFIFGTLFILICFYFMVSIKQSEKVYKFYLAYVVFYFIYILNLSGFLGYFDLGFLLYKLHLSAALLIAFLILFTRELLNTKEVCSRVDIILKFIVVALFISAICMFIQYRPWNAVINNLAFISFILLIYCSIKAYLKGNNIIKYYIFAVTIYFSSIVLFLLMLKGIVPYTNLSRYGYVIASAIETIIFSLILANRYNKLKDEVINSQNKLLKLKTANEIALEDKVEKRTKEITLAYNRVKDLSDERELLLREVYHRVKNNFHVITGTIWYKSRKYPENKMVFDDLINRIKSMSIIHEYLYKKNELTNIHLEEYIKEISNSLIIIYKDKKSKIEIEDLETKLSFESAISMGSIINEVMTNSLKHFKKDEICKISIKIKRIKNQIKITIKDNGEGFDIKNIQKGIGLELINDMSKKLFNSKYDFSFDKGTIFTISFYEKI